MNRPGVIIIDDEPDLVSELAEWFETQGWRVATGHSASDALRLLEHSGPVDCLITDRLMPSQSGDELLRRLRALPSSSQPDLIALMTGDQPAGEAEAVEGADVLFIKPVDPGAMLKAIAARLRRAIPGATVQGEASIEFA